MTKFDINRFGRTLVWSAQMTKKEILTQVVTMTFALFVPFIIHLLTSYKANPVTVAGNLLSATQMDIFIYIIICLIGGCWLFNNMKTKEQRLTFKMLPATDLEKFVARVLYVTVVWWVMGFIAFCLADLLRMLISFIAGIDIVKCAIPEFLSIIFGTGEHARYMEPTEDVRNPIAFIALVYAWFFWVYSLCIAGGALFRRRQFVFTSLLHLILILVFTPLINRLFTGFSLDETRHFFDTWVWLVSAILVILGVFNWWLSYKIFRRMQVINNKWLNL